MEIERHDRVWVRYWKQPGIVIARRSSEAGNHGRLDVQLDSGLCLGWDTDSPATAESFPDEMAGARFGYGGPEDIQYAIVDPPHESYGMTRQEEWEYIHRSMKELGWVP
jgi:hypothetical protein